MSRTNKSTEPGERLQKVLANSGVASRRKVVSLIESGLVKVDGVVVREPGARVDVAHWRAEYGEREVRTNCPWSSCDRQN